MALNFNCKREREIERERERERGERERGERERRVRERGVMNEIGQKVFFLFSCAKNAFLMASFNIIIKKQTKVPYYDSFKATPLA